MRHQSVSGYWTEDRVSDLRGTTLALTVSLTVQYYCIKIQYHHNRRTYANGWVCIPPCTDLYVAAPVTILHVSFH